MLITVCIYWFNPMVWIMYVLVNRDIELACDEGVLKESGISTRASYALTLIQMQENREERVWRKVSADMRSKKGLNLL